MSANTNVSAVEVYEFVRKHWGPHSDADRHHAYFTVHALSDMTNFLWGALPNGDQEVHIEELIQLSQTFYHLGLTTGCLDMRYSVDDTTERWQYSPEIKALFLKVRDHATFAARALDKVRDLVQGISPEEPTPSQEPVKKSSDRPVLSIAPAESVANVPVVIDCLTVFDTLEVDRLPSGALAQVTSAMFPDRWSGMSRAQLATRLPEEIRPQRSGSTKSHYTRRQFTNEPTPSKQPSNFLSAVATAFSTRTDKSLPLGWLHDCWIQIRPEAKHMAITEFSELLRLCGVRTEWTKSGHFVQRSDLEKFISPSNASPPTTGFTEDQPEAS